MAEGKKERELGNLLLRYAGPSAPLLMKHALDRASIIGLEEASQTQLVSLKENIIEYILEPMLHRGKLALARSELISVLGIDIHPVGQSLPEFIDGVRVLPSNMESILIEKFKSFGEFIMDREMKKYGLKGLSGTD